MVRLLKIVLVVIVALQALFYAIQNVVNLDAAFGAVGYVVGMNEHAAYPDHFGPAITAPALVWAAVWTIIAGETLVGLLSLKGAFDMTRARKGDAAQFNASKKFAILGCGMALVVWMGFFMAFGGAYFQMWQTEIGEGSLEGAFMYSLSSGIVLVFTTMADA